MNRGKTKSKVKTLAIFRGRKYESAQALGRFRMTCRDKAGNLKWESCFDNLIVTTGRNFLLDTTLAGSSYTVVGPFLGLISSVDFSAIAAGDTMASHAGWKEAGPTNVPDYTGNRKTMAFDAAAAGIKAMSAAEAFVFTEAGTVKGAFVALGSGAVNTKDNTSGVLFSAGLNDEGDRAVVADDTVNVSWEGEITSS